MALTPDDVVNKRFQPTKFREGYDQDEVDDFLDEVVEELRRLNDENAELRRQLAECQEGNVVPAPVSATSETADHDVPEPVMPVSAATEATFPVSTSGGGTADEAAGVLQMAQRLHDEYVNQGAQERDRIVSEAQAQAQSLVSDAEAAAKKTTDDAEETKRRTLDDLAQKKSMLEDEIEDLKAFEADYRGRLRNYIADQLSELDGQTPISAQI